MRGTEHDVVIAGGGPAGMMLGAELALAGVDVTVVEQRRDHELVGSRASGFHARTIEVLDQRGVAERFLAGVQLHRAVPFGGAMLDLSDVPTRHPYFVGIWQREIERIMADWLAELPVRILRGRRVVGAVQDDDGVDVALAEGDALRARYVVGCDGGRSVVRRAAGIAFPGRDASRSTLIAELRTVDAPPAGLHHDAAGVHAVQPQEDGTVRVVTCEPTVRSTREEATLDDLRASLLAAFGTDFGAHDPRWISRFTDATRQAAAYRAGRVLLAGDAAHVHYPTGAQGLSLGVQDAVNLGWKLARVVHGTSPAALLDSYHAERHPAAARVLEHTVVLAGMQRRADDRQEAVVDLLTELAGLDEPRRRLTGLSSGLDVHYDLGGEHPLVGRRMPDLDLDAPDGPVRTYALLHEARPVLLDLAGTGGLAAAASRHGVRVVRATYAGAWELPVVGQVAAPAAVLVRPDGHVAWVGDGTDAGLADALGTWFGPPVAAPADGAATADARPAAA